MATCLRSGSLIRLCNVSRAQIHWPRLFNSCATAFGPKPLPPRRPILDSEIEEAFLKGSGPGGQKINKTNSAVQLKHLPSGIVVKCQGTRSRDQNRKDARRLLQDKLEEIELGEGARTKVKEREQARKKASRRKKSLRKYKALDGDEVGEEADQGTENVENVENGARGKIVLQRADKISGGSVPNRNEVKGS